MLSLGEIGLFTALVQIIVENFSTEKWPFWLLTSCYAIFAYVRIPNIEKPTSRELADWGLAAPMLTAGGVVGTVIAAGTPPSPILLGFGMALMATFVFGNIIALIIHLTPMLFCDPELRSIFRRQPISFLLLFGIFYILIYQSISLLTN